MFTQALLKQLDLEILDSIQLIVTVLLQSVLRSLECSLGFFGLLDVVVFRVRVFVCRVGVVFDLNSGRCNRSFCLLKCGSRLSDYGIGCLIYFVQLLRVNAKATDALLKSLECQLCLLNGLRIVDGI